MSERPLTVPARAAVLCGRQAVVLDVFLRRHLTPERLAAFDADDETALLAGTQAVFLAAEAHRRAFPEPVAASVATEARLRSVPAPSAEWLSIEEAAMVLGVSERRVRQMAPTLGRKARGRWLLDPVRVAAEAEERGA